MKKLFFSGMVLLIVTTVCAQQKLNTASISAGLSLYNTKNISMQFENTSNKKSSIAIVAESLLYGGEDAGKYNFKSKEHLFYTGGLMYKYSYSTRNFYHNFKAGAMAGVDHLQADAFVWYPVIMLEQSFCLQPGLQLFISERCSYLMNYADRNFQPALQCGLKFSL